jgi:type II secretory pathway pseudopilin PulG
MIKIFNNRKGQTIVEVLIAAGLIALMFPVLAQGFTLSRGSSINREARHEALLLMQESLDALRTIRETGWSNIVTNGTYHPVLSSNNWSLAAGSELIGNYTRQLVIDDTERDSNGNIVPIGGTVDPSTKKVTHLISWENPVSGTIEYITYLTRYLQNAILQHTSTADFTGGTFDNTETAAIGDGAVRLTSPPLSNTFTDYYNTPGDYTYDPVKIEVNGGYAQLKLLSTAPVYQYSSNPDFDTIYNPWVFYEDGLANPTGSHLLTVGNPNGYVRIDYPTAKRKDGYGYWQQPITINSNSSAGNIQFDWKVVSYSGTPINFIIYVWLDNASNGTPATPIWNSGERRSVTSWSSTVTVDITSYISTPATKYVKVGAYVKYPTSNTGPYQIGFDNVLATWSNPPETLYVTDSPDIYPNNSFTALRVDSWDSFSTTEVPNGGSIGYQLSDDDGTTWYYYVGPPTKAWTVTTTGTNTAMEVNTNIPTFPTTNDKILVRAFLVSDGNQFVRLDTVTIDYTGVYEANTGTYTSDTLDAGQNVSFNFIEYNDYNTANTTTQIQIAANSDDSTWVYVGPDGTSGTYYTTGAGIVPQDLISDRYFRYKIYFDSQNEDQPYVENILVNFSP